MKNQLKLMPGMLNMIVLDPRYLQVMRELGSGRNVTETAKKLGISGLTVCRCRQEIKRRVQSAIHRARKRVAAVED